MSVYTVISDQEFSEIIGLYQLGQYQSSQGILAGIENTNYFISTSKGKYVFTLFEIIDRQQANLYLTLLNELAEAGIKCPQPVADANNRLVNTFRQQPYCLVTRLNGKNITTANKQQCMAIASELAKFHSHRFSSISLSDPLFINRRGKDWRESVFKKIQHHIPASDASLLAHELKLAYEFDDSQLPKGIIHADLFKDNALFDGDNLVGVIDFNDACYGTYLYDIAITVNAWCCNNEGQLVDDLVNAFFDQYQSIRPLTAVEKMAWPTMLKIATLRFWLSRLENSLLPTDDANQLTQKKDPAEYREILVNHIEQPSSVFNQ